MDVRQRLAANLRRLRELADQYDFLIVIDETIGNFANVGVLPYADVVVSSLSKIFSGAVNVMGGRYGHELCRELSVRLQPLTVSF